jgi:anti-sigma B factor antagonist
MDLKLSYEEPELGTSVIAVSGELDAHTAPTLKGRLAHLIEGGTHRLIIDLEGLEFLDSTGLGALLSALKRARAHDGSVDIICTQIRILRIFKITSLDRVFDIYDSASDVFAAQSGKNG